MFFCLHALSVPRSGQFSKSASLRKTVSFEKQNEIMSKDKYLSIFLCRMEAIVFIILQIFFETHSLCKIGGYRLDIRHFWLGNIQ